MEPQTKRATSRTQTRRGPAVGPLGIIEKQIDRALHTSLRSPSSSKVWAKRIVAKLQKYIGDDDKPGVDEKIAKLFDQMHSLDQDISNTQAVINQLDREIDTGLNDLEASLSNV